MGRETEPASCPPFQIGRGKWGRQRGNEPPGISGRTGLAGLTSLEDDDVRPSLGKFVGAGKANDSGSDNGYFHFTSGSSTGFQPVTRNLALACTSFPRRARACRQDQAVLNGVPIDVPLQATARDGLLRGATWHGHSL